MSNSIKEIAKLNSLAEALVSKVKLLETATKKERYELIEMCRMLEEELIILRYKLENEATQEEFQDEDKEQPPSELVIKEEIVETESFSESEKTLETPEFEVQDEIEVQSENSLESEDISKDEVEKKLTEIGAQFNAKESLHEKMLRKEDKSVGGALQRTPIRDLKSSMSLNDRFLFTNELFKGNGEEFVNAIEELNHLQSLDDAKRLINHNWVDKYKWDWESEIVLHFVDLLDRRYLHKS